jgi:hypothetical protein
MLETLLSVVVFPRWRCRRSESVRARPGIPVLPCDIAYFERRLDIRQRRMSAPFIGGSNKSMLSMASTLGKSYPGISNAGNLITLLSSVTSLNRCVNFSSGLLTRAEGRAH